MNKRQFTSKYKCVVKTSKQKVYDYKKKKQIRHHKHTTNPKLRYPTIGYLCEYCQTYNLENLYSVNNKIVHEKCGIKMLSTQPNMNTTLTKETNQ